jgi:hypothetical protein
MKSNTHNSQLIKLYLDALQQPLPQRYNMKELIFDLVPTKRLLYQVFIMPPKATDYSTSSEQTEGLSATDLRFIHFLETTDFSADELTQIFQAHAEMNKGIPEQYKLRLPQQSKAFAFYGRKFGRQPVLNHQELDSLYSQS